MRNLKNLLPLFAVLIGFGLVFTQSAFKNADKKATLTYRYNGSNAAGVTTAANWTDPSVDPDPQGCAAGTEIPCLVQFETSEYANISAFIAAKPSNSQMLSSGKVQTRKDEQ
jgi:hypothetical protein